MSSEVKTSDPIEEACENINEYARIYIYPIVQEVRTTLVNLITELENKRAANEECSSVESAIDDLFHEFRLRITKIVAVQNLKESEGNFLIKKLLHLRLHRLGYIVNHWRHLSGFDKDALLNLMSFDKINREELHFGNKDICELVGTAIFIMSSRCNILFNLQKKDRLVYLTKCHSIIIREVFLEVLENAKYAIDDEGMIEVDIEAEGDFVSIIIRDNGKGIPSCNFEKVTQSGFTTKEDGTGQGLHLIKSYVENTLGGRLEIQSTEGVGTTVKIILPLSKAEVIA